MAKARASAVINQPIETVWARIRDFTSHTSWIHGAKSAELLNGTETKVGIVRRLTFANGIQLDELVTGLDDTEHSMSYAVISEYPEVSNVTGLIRLHSITSNDTTLVERVMYFDCGLLGEELDKLVTSRIEIFAASLELLARSFA